MIRRLLTTLIAFPCASTISAATPSAPDTVVSTTLVSNYLFRGQRLGGLSLQPAAEITAGDTFAGMTANFPIENKVADQSDPEIDFYGTHGFALSRQFRLTPGLTIYLFPNAPTGAGYFRSIIEPNLALSYTVAGARLISTCYYDASRKGTIVELAGVIALPLTRLGTELDLAASVGRYDFRDASNLSGPKRRMWGTYASCTATIPYQITLQSKITVAFTYAAGFNSYIKNGASRRVANPIAGRRGVLQLGYAYVF